jgi:hypothetical protein
LESISDIYSGWTDPNTGFATRAVTRIVTLELEVFGSSRAVYVISSFAVINSNWSVCIKHHCLNPRIGTDVTTKSFSNPSDVQQEKACKTKPKS